MSTNIIELRKQRTRARPARRQRGMTLTEIMIVITIIGAITAAIGVGVFAQAEKGRISLAKSAGQRLRSAVKTYKMENTESDECPTFDALIKAKSIEASQKRDPWGHDWAITCTDSDVVLTSPGKDLKDNSDDIIVGGK